MDIVNSCEPEIDKGDKVRGGTIYLVATPIGNLKDITLRGLEILKAVDIIACEDTRQTRKLLSHYGISAHLVSCWKENEEGSARRLIDRLKRGESVALVSDAGTPGLSDPGEVVVRKAVEEGITVVPAPGPSALLAALSASGLSTNRFIFEGFLSRKPGERRNRLVELIVEQRTIIFYESPQRVRDTLVDIRQIMGERVVVVVRELTKVYEEFIRGRIGEVLERLGKSEVRGEIVILVQGSEAAINWDKVDLTAFRRMLATRLGIEEKQAIKLVAQLSGIAKSVIYKEAL